MRIYFDSCILIYRIEQRVPWTQRMTARLTALDPAVTTTVTSELARLDVEFDRSHSGNTAC